MIRLKRIFFAGAVALASGSHASAALAPNNQRVAELQAILDDSAVVDALKVQPIDRVEFIKADLYRVTAGVCHVDVAIVDMPVEEGLVGPRQFKIEIVDRTCPE